MAAVVTAGLAGGFPVTGLGTFETRKGGLLGAVLVSCRRCEATFHEAVTPVTAVWALI